MKCMRGFFLFTTWDKLGEMYSQYTSNIAHVSILYNIIKRWTTAVFGKIAQQPQDV